MAGPLRVGIGGTWSHGVAAGLERRLGNLREPLDRVPDVRVELTVRPTLFRQDNLIVTANGGDRVERHDFRLERRGPRVWRGQVSDEPEAAEAALRWILGITLLELGGLLVHGATAVWSGLAHAFLGASGAGKSTLAFEGGADTVLCDEVSILAPNGAGQWWAWTSPFWGAEDRARGPKSAPLAGIWLLNGWERTAAAAVAPADAALAIYERVIDMGADARAPGLALRAVAELVEAAPARRLCWRRGDALGPLLQVSWETLDAGRKAPVGESSIEHSA